MSTFVLESDNRIRAFAPSEPVAETDQPEKFKTLDELTALSEGWPMTRLLAIWNTLPGVTPVKKFTDRKTAIARIWKAIQGPYSRNIGRPRPTSLRQLKQQLGRHGIPTPCRSRQRSSPQFLSDCPVSFFFGCTGAPS